LEKNQNGGQKSRWRRVDFFWTEMPQRAVLRLFEKIFFDANLWVISHFILKKPIWDFEIWQNGRNIQNGVINLLFLVILVSKLQLLTDFKKFDYIRSGFLLSNFFSFFFKNTKWPIFRRWRHFWEKIVFFSKGSFSP
jgi:hypothetical protein